MSNEKVKDCNDLVRVKGQEALDECVLEAVGLKVSVKDDTIDDNKKDAAQYSVPKQLLDPGKGINIMIPQKEEKASIIDLFPISHGEPCLNFTTDFFPEIYQKYLSTLFDSSSAHPVILTASFLTSTKSFMKGRLFHYISPGAPIFPRSWYLILSDSGSRKTTGLEYGMRLVNRVEDEISDELALIDPTGYTSEKLQEEQEKYFKRSLILANSGSFPGMEDSLYDTSGGGIFVDEMRQWMEFFGLQCNGSAKSQFTKLYNCPRNYKAKTRSRGTFYLKYPVISMCAISTQSWFEDMQLSSDWDGGFYFRYDMFTLPKPKEKEATFIDESLDVDTAAETKIYKILDSLVKSCPIDNNTPLDENSRIMYKRSPEATRECEILDQYLFDKFREIDDSGFLETARRRVISKVLSDAIHYQYFFNPSSEFIEKRSVLAAYSFFKHSIDTLIKLFNQSINTTSKTVRRMQAFMMWAQNFKEKNNRAPTRNDALNNCRATGTAKILDMVLETLVETEKVEVIKGSTKKGDDIYKLQ